MKWVDVEPGEPGRGEICVKHHAVGLNFIDVYFRNGLYPMPLPGGLGMEAAGEVTAVGEGVTQFKPGDRVAYASRPPGAYAQERVMSADYVVALPGPIGYEDAASIMLQGLTAQYLLRRTYPREGGRHGAHPRRGGRGRHARVPVGEGARRDGDRHGRLGREGGAREGRTAATIRSSIRARTSPSACARSRTARACRLSTIRSARTHIPRRSIAFRRSGFS